MTGIDRLEGESTNRSQGDPKKPNFPRNSDVASEALTPPKRGIMLEGSGSADAPRGPRSKLK